MRKLIEVALSLLFLLPSLKQARAQAFRVGSGVQMVPRTTAPTKASANGSLYINSSDSYKLHYVKPDGTDAEVGGGGGGLTGTLTLARIPFASGASALSDDAALTWDTTLKSITMSYARALGTTSVPAIDIESTTAATSGNQQNSGMLVLGSQGWHPTGSTSDAIKVGLRERPLQSIYSTSPIVQLDLMQSNGNNGTSGAWTRFGTLSAVTDSSSSTNGMVIAGSTDGSSDTPAIALVNTEIYFAASAAAYRGGAPFAFMQSTHFSPVTDGGISFGSASRRANTGYVGASGALPTCDATTRGAFRTVFAAGGASDTFQVCMKAAADTYAFRTVYTAP